MAAHSRKNVVHGSVAIKQSAPAPDNSILWFDQPEFSEISRVGGKQALTDTGAAIRRLIVDAEIPAPIAESIRAAYKDGDTNEIFLVQARPETVQSAKSVTVLKTYSLNRKGIIERAHRAGTKVGICGQAPSNYPDFAAFLVETGIDSISLNPDSFVSTTQIVDATERKLGRLGK